MDIYAQTKLAARFNNGDDISIDVIDTQNGVQVESKVFNRRNHNIEEVIDFIESNSYEYEVYF